MTKLLLVLTIIVAQQPRSRVQTEYLKDNNRTLISANTLYLSNSPSQFVQLQLRCVTWGKRALFPAEEVMLEFYSFAQRPLFKRSESRVVEVVAGDKTTKLARLDYKTPSSDIAQSILPKSAQLSGKVSLEVLIAQVPPEFVQSLIDADRVEFKFGDTTFALNEEHRGILREFGTYVMPASDAVPGPGDGVTLIEPALPKELTNAPLGVVLRWLRDSLEREAVTPLNGRMDRFQAGEFSTCKVDFRIAKIDGGRPIFARLHKLDFAELTPELVKTVGYNDRAYLYYRSENGRVANSIALYSSKHAAEITAAFKQVVTLCSQ